MYVYILLVYLGHELRKQFFEKMNKHFFFSGGGYIFMFQLFSREGLFQKTKLGAPFMNTAVARDPMCPYSKPFCPIEPAGDFFFRTGGGCYDDVNVNVQTRLLR